MRWSRHCIQRAPPPSPADLLHEILQWGPHASIPGERCTGLARRRSRRAHSWSPNPGRTASPICPDLIYDRHRYDSAMEASFFINEDALKRIQPDARLDESGFPNAFDSNRDLICAAADNDYVRGSRGSYDLVAANF